jgi:hypothetical protein
MPGVAMDHETLDNLLNRLAETEYTAVADPDYVDDSLFGRFVTDPRFPNRYDANQHFDTRVGFGQVELFLRSLERCYDGTGLAYRKVCGHDPATCELLRPVLESKGFSVRRCWMMTFEHEPLRPINPDVRVEVVADPSSHPDLSLVHGGGMRSEGGFAYQVAQTERLGGETLLAWLDGRPAGTTGWFVVGGIARYRWVGTLPWARGRGVASTLVQYVQTRPEVQAQEALTIFCGEDGPVRLYESLGFVKQGWMWEMLKLPRG